MESRRKALSSADAYSSDQSSSVAQKHYLKVLRQPPEGLSLGFLKVCAVETGRVQATNLRRRQRATGQGAPLGTLEEFRVHPAASSTVRGSQLTGAWEVAGSGVRPGQVPAEGTPQVRQLPKPLTPTVHLPDSGADQGWCAVSVSLAGISVEDRLGFIRLDPACRRRSSVAGQPLDRPEIHTNSSGNTLRVDTIA